MISKDNNVTIVYRKFHIDSFPADRIFVQLKEDFHNELFQKIRQYKFKNFNKLFFENRLNYSTFKIWKKRKTIFSARTKEHFIPLSFIIKIPIIFSEYSIEIIEKNISAYKGPSSSNVITAPNLPLIEDQRLLKILAHLIGDGSKGGAFGTKLPKGKQHSEYRNFRSELLDSFENDLSVFGNVPTSKNYIHGHLMISNVIGYILEQIYKIKFDTFNSRVPKDLFDLPRELVAAFLRAYGDDEGHVYDSSIDYYSNNKNLMNEVLLLINKTFPEIHTSKLKSNAKAGKNIKYSITIYHTSQEKYLQYIGFDHKQKTEDLKFNLIRRNSKDNRYQKEAILRLLKDENLTAKHISRRLVTSHRNILYHLNQLKRDNKVYRIKKEGWSNIWAIKIQQKQ